MEVVRVSDILLEYGKLVFGEAEAEDIVSLAVLLDYALHNGYFYDLPEELIDIALSAVERGWEIYKYVNEELWRERPYLTVSDIWRLTSSMEKKDPYIRAVLEKIAEHMGWDEERAYEAVFGEINHGYDYKILSLYKRLRRILKNLKPHLEEDYFPPYLGGLGAELITIIDTLIQYVHGGMFPDAAFEWDLDIPCVKDFLNDLREGKYKSYREFKKAVMCAVRYELEQCRKEDIEEVCELD